MVTTSRFKTFDEALLDKHPELKEVLRPNDHYPELMHILKIRDSSLPVGSMNTKVIINDGEIIECVYKTPNGQFI